MNKLKSVIALKGMKNKELAEKLGVSPQYLSRLLSGKIDLRLSTVKQIAEILEVSITDIVE